MGWKQATAAQSLPSSGQEKTSTPPGWLYSPPAAALVDNTLFGICFSDTLSRVVSEYIEIFHRNVVNGQISSSLSRSIPMLIIVIQELCFTPTSVSSGFVKEPSAGPEGQINVSIFPILQILKMRQRVEITCLKTTGWIWNWTRCRNYTIIYFQ